ncbi:MAG: hypothetical protein BWY66_01146 [bacterium ADurb.Bin374]|nr:MAG: hypothetical protein BWY66_01146 [bacterium ADurb.Bin374]
MQMGEEDRHVAPFPAEFEAFRVVLADLVPDLVGNEPPHAFAMAQLLGHLIERGREPAELVVGGDRRPGVVVAVGDIADEGGEGANLVDQASRQEQGAADHPDDAPGQHQGEELENGPAPLVEHGGVDPAGKQIPADLLGEKARDQRLFPVQSAERRLMRPERLDPVEQVHELRVAPHAVGQEAAVAAKHRDPHGPVFARFGAPDHLPDVRPGELGFVERIADEAPDTTAPVGKPGVSDDHVPLADAHPVEFADLPGRVR